MAELLVFVFGLIIGSFLNVLIYRLPIKKSIFGFSKCQKCGKEIFWYDKIPVLSFLILKGGCRNCGSKISFQYPFIELLSGILFLISFLVYRENVVFLVYILFLASFLIAVAFIDLRHFLILDNLVFAGFLASLPYFLIFNFRFSSGCRIVSCSISDSIFGLLFFAGIFLFLFLVTKGRGLGLGDVNLAAFLGFVFGLEKAVNVFSLTFSLGFIVAIILLVFKKAGLKSKMPLGLVMAAASILFLLSGFNLLDLINGGLILRLWINQ